MSQDDFQNFTANDRGFTEDEETGILRRETFDESRGEEVSMAPTSAMRDALTRLQSGTGTFGYSTFPGSAGTEGRLEEMMPETGEARRLQRTWFVV